ncbi:acyl-CoA synthetase [Tomitella biformata]|uniref:acyl-CoA synthetase n=1 Tax=Tomitella biformata TaxID=630403 RepID=UPI000463383A|nr:acyl-CoA synthetase [Tomitella biformata]
MTLNIATLFESVADAVPDRVVLTCESEQRSYAQLEVRANRLAHHLQSVGVGPGDHVAVHMRNRIEYVECVLACLKVRAVPINVNYRYVEAELVHVYGNSQAVALIVEAEYLAAARAALASCPTVGHVVVVDSAAPAADDTAGYEPALAAQSPERDFGPRSADDKFIIYTGGTTGYPKGVVWRHEDFYFAALSGANTSGPPRLTLEEVVAAAVANSAAPVFLLVPPLMHGAAVYSLLTAFLAGSRRVIMRDFDAVEALRVIEAERVTGITVVGDGIARPLAEAMEQHPEIDLSSLKMVGSGGALFSTGVKDQLRERVPGLVIKDAFGASETGNDGIVEFAADGTKRIRSNPNMVLVDNDFRPVGPGIEGFIARSGHVPLEYWGDPVKSASTFPVIDGIRMAVLGDRGILEGDGTIVLLGRGSNCINSGGEKIYPEEVEQALKTHPAVYDALVVGIPDKRFGQRVAAAVALREGHSGASPEELTEYCRTQVAGYKIPRVVVFAEEVKRSPSGKADYPWALRTVLAAD